MSIENDNFCTNPAIQSDSSRPALAQVEKDPVAGERQQRRRLRLGQLTPESIIDLKDVIELTTLSKSTIYRKMAAGTFPSNRKLSVNRAGWRTANVLAWLDELN